MDQRPIGVFDSGVGGLSVVREICRVLPGENIVYFADQANCPYGSRSTDEIRSLATDAASRLLARDVKLVVVACNTASTAALAQLRETFDVPFVGIVPAIKPACALTRTGKVGVLATEATLRSTALETLIERYSHGAEVQRLACPEFVALVEAGMGDDRETERIVRSKLARLLAIDVDQIVLGCTHFEFLRGTIEKVAGPGVRVVGAARPVAEQSARVLSQGDLLARRDGGAVHLETSGKPGDFLVLGRALLDGAAA